MEAGLSDAASPGAGETATLTSTLAWWALDPAAAWIANRGAVVQIATVTFELFASPYGAPVQRFAERVYHPAEEGVTDRSRQDLAGAADAQRVHAEAMAQPGA